MRFAGIFVLTRLFWNIIVSDNLLPKFSADTLRRSYNTRLYHSQWYPKILEGAKILEMIRQITMGLLNSDLFECTKTKEFRVNDKHANSVVSCETEN